MGRRRPMVNRATSCASVYPRRYVPRMHTRHGTVTTREGERIAWPHREGERQSTLPASTVRALLSEHVSERAEALAGLSEVQIEHLYGAKLGAARPLDGRTSAQRNALALRAAWRRLRALRCDAYAREVVCGENALVRASRQRGRAAVMAALCEADRGNNDEQEEQG